MAPLFPRGKKDTKHALEEANAAHAATGDKIEKLRRDREEALLGDASDAAIEKLDQDIETISKTHRVQGDRVAALEAQAKREAAERQAREKEALIVRVEAIFAELKKEGQYIAGAIAKADAGFRRLLDLAGQVRAAWPFAQHDLVACFLTNETIVAALTHEIYRVGARPPLLGGQDKPGTTVSFPGGKAPRLEIAGLPEKIPPLAQVIEQAAECASTIMRTGRSTAAAVDVVAASTPEAPERTAATIRLAQLLNKQLELAEAGASDEEYNAVLSEVMKAQADVDLEQAGAQT